MTSAKARAARAMFEWIKRLLVLFTVASRVQVNIDVNDVDFTGAAVDVNTVAVASTPDDSEPSGPRRRRSYHHGDLRQALLDAAVELLRQHGPAGFSLREAARSVGVDPAACYRHFRSREDLLMALAQQGFAALAARMTSVRARRRGASARGRLLAMGHEYVAFAADDPARFRVMFGDSGTHARDPGLRLPSVDRSAFEQLEDEIVALAREEGGRARLPETAYLLWAAMHGVARLAIDGAFPPGATPSRSLVDTLGRAVLDARFAGHHKA